MVSEAVVFEVFNDVREWFSLGDGAWNKTYDRAVALRAGKSLEKINAMTPLDDRRIKQGKNSEPFAGGKLISNQRVHGGNCVHYAMLSGFFLKRLGVDRAEVWLAGIESPGDHAFCVVGEFVPAAWTSVATMVLRPARPKACWIVDGSLNVCCDSRDYPRLAQTALNRWLSVGKRIYWTGTDGNRKGWYEPGKDYSDGFLRGPLVFHNSGVQRGFRE